MDEIISTRRLVHILRAYAIFGKKEKAISVCVNRFDDETKQSFLELYDKVDADFEFDKAEDKAYEEWRIFGQVIRQFFTVPSPKCTKY